MRDIYDTERFKDYCEETRTKSQILWEEGIYREGSFRQKWAYNFGRNGFYKFGKKISAFLILVFFWVSFSTVFNDNIFKRFLQVTAVVAVNAASIWLFRQTEVYKKFTKINIIYIICCGIFTVLFYKYMDYIFGYIGHSLFLSLYYGTYMMSEITVNIVRIIVTIALIYNIVRYNIRDKGINIFASLAAVISLITGVLYRYFVSDSIILYNVVIIILILAMAAGFLIYIKSKNKFLRNISLAFSFISLMEVIGSYAVYTGFMEYYIVNGL